MLADYYRQTLTINEDFVTLTTELQNVNNYLTIAQARFINAIHFTAVLPKDTDRFRMPPLIIQPLVENAILHGLDKRREGGGELDIRLRREGDRLVFSVLDNGPGLSEEMERQLNEPGGQGSGYGVRNVRDRIVLSYGNEYGVRAENRPEGGCAAILTLPVLTNENNCDES